VTCVPSLFRRSRDGAPVVLLALSTQLSMMVPFVNTEPIQALLLEVGGT